MAQSASAPLTAQEREQLYGPEIIRIASDVLWRVMYEHPDPTEKTYKPTTHCMETQVYRKVLADNGYTEEDIEKMKKEKRGSDEPVLKIEGKMHAACENDDTNNTDVLAEPIISIEIWDYHLPREARFQWPIKKLTEKKDLREHKKLIREYKEEREAAELEYVLVDEEVCKERRKVSEKEEKLRKELDDEKDERKEDKVKMDEMEKKIQELQEKLEVSEKLRADLEKDNTEKDKKIEKFQEKLEGSERLRIELEKDNKEKDEKIEKLEGELTSNTPVEMDDEQESPEEMEEEEERESLWEEENAQLKKVLETQAKALALEKIRADNGEYLIKRLVQHLEKRGGRATALKKRDAHRDSKELHSLACAFLLPKPHQVPVHAPLQVVVPAEEDTQHIDYSLLTPEDDTMMEVDN